MMNNTQLKIRSSLNLAGHLWVPPVSRPIIPWQQIIENIKLFSNPMTWCDLVTLKEFHR